MASKDIEITMTSGLLTGESWQATYQQLPSGSVTPVSPNPTTNPFYIRGIDDANCYKVKVKKKCADATYGVEEEFIIGTCDPEDPPTTVACYTYYLTNSLSYNQNYNYTGCSGSENTGLVLEGGGSAYICAREGAVTADAGISVTRMGACEAAELAPVQRTIEWNITVGIQRVGTLYIKKNGTPYSPALTSGGSLSGSFTAIDGDTIDIQITGSSLVWIGGFPGQALCVLTVKDGVGATIHTGSSYSTVSWSVVVGGNMRIEAVVT